MLYFSFLWSRVLGYDDILELLILNGANVNVRQKNGCTALMLACEQGLRCTVELLLLMGARVNPQINGNKGESALIKVGSIVELLDSFNTFLGNK